MHTIPPRAYLRSFYPLLFIGILTLVTITYAEEYYADVNINILDTGKVDITGLRNYPELLSNTTQEFTSKKGEYWMFNLNFSEPLLVYSYTVSMPKNAVINYVHANVPLKISTLNDQTVLEGSGENESLRLTIQYSIPEIQIEDTNSTSITNSIVLIIIVITCIVLIIVGWFGFFSKKKRNLQQPWYALKPLTDRQREILKFIEEKDSVTQRHLEKDLEIPKSSLSRNIDTLVRIGILRKETNGMTNTLLINKEKPDIKIPRY